MHFCSMLYFHVVSLNLQNLLLNPEWSVTWQTLLVQFLVILSQSIDTIGNLRLDAGKHGILILLLA